MSERRKFIKRPGTAVRAIQLDMETSGFQYFKWGSEQTCKRGDWIVNNNGDVYTVDQETFEKTYQAEGLGLYRKTAAIWAEVATQDGSIPTKEGLTRYKAGDYVVFNNENGTDGYAVSRCTFEEMYVACQP
jgi:hypothetical protein